MSNINQAPESNLFGLATQSGGTDYPAEPASNSKTDAGILADHISYLVGKYAFQAGQSADWLSVAANAGQNGDPAGFALRQYTEPLPVVSASLVSNWQLGTPPALLTLPALPDGMKIDTAKIRSDWLQDVGTLQQSWMASFLPAVTDVSALNALFNSILNGSAQASFEARLATLETAIQNAIASISASSLAALTALAATVQTNVDANIATQKANIASAIAVASDATQTIAWQRARDQAAREAKRLEDEAMTQFASRGFSLPPGILVNVVAHQKQATLDSAVEIAAREAEKIQGAFIELAKVQIDNWARVMEIQNRSEIERYRAIADSNLRYATLQLEGNKEVAELAIKHLGLTLDFTKFSGELAVKYRLGVIEGINGLIHAYAGLRGNETEYARAIAQAQTQATGALVEYYRAAIGAAEVGLRTEVANRENSIRYMGVAADFIAKAVGNYVNAAGQAAHVFSQIASQAAGGLTTVATLTKSS